MSMKHHLALAAIALALTAAPGRVQAAFPPCHADRLDSIDVYTSANGGGLFVPVRRNLHGTALIQAVLALHGRNIWVGYDNGGFDPMPSRHDLLLVVYWAQGGSVYSNYIWFAESDGYPAYRYVYVYPTMQEYTDAHGRHMGAHPVCGTFEIGLDTYTRLLALAGLR